MNVPTAMTTPFSAHLADWPGLGDPVRDSQRLFRQILDALSRPGSIHQLQQATPPDTRLGAALWGSLLTLCDLDTRVWLDPELDTPPLRQALQFHTGCEYVERSLDADFAVIGADTPLDVLAFDAGSAESPERSATLLILTRALHDQDGLTLRGPGIADRCRLQVGPRPGLPALLAANREYFPRGLDLLFVCGDRLAGLPRSTRCQEVN